MILVLNMQDVAQRRGMAVDSQRLAALLPSVTVIATAARTQVGMDLLRRAILDFVAQRRALPHAPQADPSQPDRSQPALIPVPVAAAVEHRSEGAACH